jgi:hypothetical protein
MVQSMTNSNDTKNYQCHCRVCETSRAYQKEHHEQHAVNVRKYYNRNRESILMQKAYKRFLSGSTKKLQRQTLIRLANAGLKVPQMALSDTSDETDVRPLSLSAFTSIEVS